MSRDQSGLERKESRDEPRDIVAGHDRKAMTERINLHDYEEAAREALPGMVYDYYAGGAGDEISVRENVAAWGRVRLRPRVLVDVSRRRVRCPERRG